MKLEFDPRLEALLDTELKNLPPLQAPASIAINVLSVITARTRLPWWRHSWWDWPVAAKAAFLLIAIALAGAAGHGGMVLDEGFASYSEHVTARLSPFASVWETLGTVAGALGLIWEKAAEPFLLHALVGLGFLYLAFLGLGTACFRYVLKRR